MYGVYTDKIRDVDAYLKRICLSRTDIELSPEGLDRLVAAQLNSIPFENLDIFEHEEAVALDIASLEEKIIKNRRGGYCFELNAIFMSLLQTLGFEAYAHAARIVRGDTYMRPLSHRVTIVVIDGLRYFCDVGFGGPVPSCALRLDDESAQNNGSNTFYTSQFDAKHRLLSRRVSDRKEAIMLIVDEPYFVPDFLPLNSYMAEPNSYFRSKRMANLRTERGTVALDGNVLRTRENGERQERVLSTKAELELALRDNFGIEFNVIKPV